MPDPVLSIRGLTTEISTNYGTVIAAQGITFDLEPGETLGIVGESGSGKTISMLSILGLLPSRVARITAGSVVFDGQDITAATPRTLKKLRGKELGVIFQDPMTSLNPVLTIGWQLVEAIRAHRSEMTKKQSEERAVELLDLVGVPNASIRLSQYPHEFSGGMKQRAMIAMAIANGPKVLIADEPTTALDVTIQAQILEVLQIAQRETSAALILITHDLGVIAEMADRVLVMYSGRVVETGTVADVFHDPRHPYTVGLLTSLPKIGIELDRLIPIPGMPPGGLDIPSGCAFHPRCEMSQGRELCRLEVPSLIDLNSNKATACHFYDEVPAWRNIEQGRRDSRA